MTNILIISTVLLFTISTLYVYYKKKVLSKKIPFDIKYGNKNY